MRSVSPAVTFFAVIAIRLAASEVSILEGDSCGVTSADLFYEDFAGKYRVAGTTGCTLADKSGCLCAPDLNNDDRLSEWKWQCDNSVKFGPVGNKVCPVTIPVPKGDSANLMASKECDTAVNPTGQPGDEVCSYSDCDTGGDHSAICGCVDLAAYGMGEGQQWFCLQSTCSCSASADMLQDTAADEPETAAEPMDSAASMASTALPLVLSVVGLVHLAMPN